MELHPMEPRKRPRLWLVAAIGGCASLAIYGGLGALGVGEPWQSILFFVLLMVTVFTEARRGNLPPLGS